MKTTGKSSKLGMIVLYAIASIVLLAGIATLVSNVKIYLDTVAEYVNQYISQGYTASDINNLGLKQYFIMRLLLPSIFESLVYCGVGAALFGIAAIFRKVSLLSAAIVGTPAVESAPAESTDMDYEAE